MLAEKYHMKDPIKSQLPIEDRLIQEKAEIEYKRELQK